MRRRAECCCGAVQVVVDGEPAINAICHCTNCKRRTGTAFGWSAYFSEQQVVEKRGATAKYAVALHDQQRFFCKFCGTTVYWTSGPFPAMIGIAGGCFTDPGLNQPDTTVSNDGKCAWVGLPVEWSRLLYGE